MGQFLPLLWSRYEVIRMDKYGYIGIETLLEFCENSKDHAVTPNDFMRMNRVQIPNQQEGTWIIDSGYPQHCWCSECNHLFSLFDPKSIHFCPNCGSEMKTCIWKSQDQTEVTDKMEM